MGSEQTEQKQRDEDDERSTGSSGSAAGGADRGDADRGSADRGSGGAGGGERYQVLPMDDVPGVRGPMSSSGEGEMPPEGDLESWGSEGGAGSYQGAPNFSEARVPTAGSRGKRR